MKEMKDFSKKLSGKEMLCFLFPLLLSGLFQQIFLPYSTTISARYLPEESLAVIGSLGACKSIENAVFVGMSTGFAFCVNREVNNRNPQKYLRVFRSALLLTMVFLLISIILALFPDSILTISNVPESIRGEARGYLSFLLLAGGFWGVEDMLLSAIQGRGRTVFTSVTVVLATMVQLVSLWVMLDGLSLGVEAVSLAMLVYHMFLCICLLGFLLRTSWGRELLLRFQGKISFTDSMRELKELFKSGAAKSSMMLMVSLGFFVMQRNVNRMPVENLAGYAHAESLNSLLWQPLCVCGTAAGIISARTLGNSRRDLCQFYNRQLMKYCVVWCLGLMIFAFPGADLLIRIMAGAKAEAGVVEAGAIWIQIAIPSYFLLSVLMIGRNALQAMKNYRALLLLGFLEMSVNLFCGWVMIPVWGYRGFCMANVLRWGIPGLAAGLIYWEKIRS